MKLQDNPAVLLCLHQLAQTIRTEKHAGRLMVSMWEVFALTDSGTSIFGEGCRCRHCTLEIAEAAPKEHERAAATPFAAQVH